uniref:Mut7-C domain-containing protein n=1 Tax=Meloidogyne hapla TaxID=6305 RepID=A0A1I8BA93_MELHA
MPYLQYLPATFNAMSFIHRGKFDELDVSNNPLLVTHNEELLIENIVLTIPKLVDLASASLLNYPQYWVDDGSQLLRQEILDCLPVTLHNEIRKGLLRCQYCSKLHPSSLVFYFFRVGSINLIAHTYIGPIGYLVRSQSCKKCGNTVKRVVFRWV